MYWTWLYVHIHVQWWWNPSTYDTLLTARTFPADFFKNTQQEIFLWFIAPRLDFPDSFQHMMCRLPMLCTLFVEFSSSLFLSRTGNFLRCLTHSGEFSTNFQREFLKNVGDNFQNAAVFSSNKTKFLIVLQKIACIKIKNNRVKF